MSQTPTNLELVILTWLDAHTDTSEFSLTELDEKHKAWQIETVGWLLRDNQEGVSLANEKTSPETYRGFTFVPKGMVLSVKPYKSPRKPRIAKPKSVKPIESNEPS